MIKKIGTHKLHNKQKKKSVCMVSPPEVVYADPELRHWLRLDESIGKIDGDGLSDWIKTVCRLDKHPIFFILAI